MDEIFLMLGRKDGKAAVSLLPSLFINPESPEDERRADPRLLLGLAETMEGIAKAFRECAADYKPTSFSMN